MNTIGSYVCSCDAGHILSNDGHTCDVMDCGKPDGMPGIVVKCDGTVDQHRLDINSREALYDGFQHVGRHSYWNDWQ